MLTAVTSCFPSVGENSTVKDTAPEIQFLPKSKTALFFVSSLPVLLMPAVIFLMKCK